jgi:uncharacterized membrane protein YdcZ (DUF606 family)
MHHVEALWLKIFGVLLILFGLVLFASPEITYTTREEIAHTGLKVKREKTIVIPRPAAVLIIGAGVIALFVASRSTANSEP